jgi:hypothetical protein
LKHYFRLKGAAAEQIVHDLAMKSFFTDWCYLNPVLPTGKELCDLLIVFDNVAIIWQIKDLKLQENGRYKRKEVEKNTRQLSGAYRRLMDEKHPVTLNNPRRGNEVFDRNAIKECFLISVLSGEGEEFFFSMEKINDKYVHVFTGKFLDIVLGELDTVDDFIGYLRAKEKIHDKKTGFHIMGGEEELLAIFLENNRSFSQFEGRKVIMIDKGIWEDFQKHSKYLAKQKENKISYGWDCMINRAHESGVAEYERIARELARPNRFSRRVLAKSFFEAHVIAHEDHDNDMFRRVMELDNTTYCFLFMNDPEPRNRRKNILSDLCFVARSKFKQNSSVIGIATEKRMEPECSYDFCYFNIPESTPELEAQAKEIQQQKGILTNVTVKKTCEDEYPI